MTGTPGSESLWRPAEAARLLPYAALVALALIWGASFLMLPGASFTGRSAGSGSRQVAEDHRWWSGSSAALAAEPGEESLLRSRADDLIISSGYNIAGPEVVQALLLHPEGVEAAVVGVPDQERGMLVKAYVVLRPGAVADPSLAEALQEFVKAEIAPYMYPRAIEFLDALPRTSTGKVQRYVLRSRASG